MSHTVVGEVGYVGCCGVQEICNFCSHSDYPQNYDYSATADTLPNAWISLLGEMTKSYDVGIVFHVWFVKYPNYHGNFEGQEWDNKEFRDVVKRIKDVKSLGQTKNPNTDNMIDGYAWISTGKVELKDE